jgi:hypothetical protein
MLHKILGVAALALGGVVLVGSWANTARTADKADKAAAPFVHTVIFHVSKDAPPGEVDALITDANELLRPIPTVRDLRVGRPAEPGSDIAKKDYQVGLLVLFDNYQGLKTYLDHPLHLKYVEKHLKHIDKDKLAIYDFVNQKK